MQFLGQKEDADDCYKIGYKISLEELGAQHSLTNSMKQYAGGIRKMSPNYERPARVYERSSMSPKTIPVNSAKSRSTSNDSKRNLNRSYIFPENPQYTYETGSQRHKSVKSKQIYPRNIEIQRPFANKIFNEDEGLMKSNNSFNSLNGISRRIDISKHKATERIAAIIIQSWWRGVKARKKFKELKLNFKLKQAEAKARRAVEEYEKLKQQAAKINKKK